MSTLLGASATMQGYNDSQSFIDLENGGGSNSGPGTGKLKVRRTFEGDDGLPTWSGGPWSIDISTHAVDLSWISFKWTDSAGLIAGDYDSQFAAFISSVGNDGGASGGLFWITLFGRPSTF